MLRAVMAPATVVALPLLMALAGRALAALPVPDADGAVPGAGAALSVPIERGQLRLKVDFDRRRGSVLFNFTFDRPDGEPAVIIPAAASVIDDSGEGRQLFDGAPAAGLNTDRSKKAITPLPERNVDKGPSTGRTTLLFSTTTAPETTSTDRGTTEDIPRYVTVSGSTQRTGLPQPPPFFAVDLEETARADSGGGGASEIFAAPPRRIVRLPDTLPAEGAGGQSPLDAGEPRIVMLRREAEVVNGSAPPADNNAVDGALAVQKVPQRRIVERDAANPCHPQYLQPCASAIGRGCRLVSTPSGCARCVCPIGSPAHGCLGARALTARRQPARPFQIDQLGLGFVDRSGGVGAELADRREALMLATVTCDDGTKAQIVHRWQRRVDPSTGHALCVETKQPYCAIEAQRSADDWRMPRTEKECYYFCFDREPSKTP